MANISPELQAISQAVYGEQVRGSIVSAIEKINAVSEVVITAGTAVTTSTSSSIGFYADSLYLNTNTWDLWRCVTTNSWENLGNLKGAAGPEGSQGISVVGIVDKGNGQFTLRLSDGTQTTAIQTIKGEKGDTGATGAAGAAGRSVVKIEAGTKSGLLNPIYAYYSDGSSQLIGNISDGQSGAGTGDMSYVDYDANQTGIVNYANGLADRNGNFMSYNLISNKADKSTTLAGYGITDAYTQSEVDYSLGLKITKPSNPSDGQVLTYDSETSSWVAEDSQGGSGTWSDISGKPFSTIGSDLKVSGNALGISDANKTKIDKINTAALTNGYVCSVSNEGKIISTSVKENNLVENANADSWSSSTTYAKGEYVVRLGKLYRSLQDANKSYRPELENSYWKQILLNEVDNSVDALNDFVSKAVTYSSQNVTKGTTATMTTKTGAFQGAMFIFGSASAANAIYMIRKTGSGSMSSYKWCGTSDINVTTSGDVISIQNTSNASATIRVIVFEGGFV